MKSSRLDGAYSRHAACCRTSLAPAARGKVWRAVWLRQGEPAKTLAPQTPGRLVHRALHGTST